jgi:hypothetical protein
LGRALPCRRGLLYVSRWPAAKLISGNFTKLALGFIPVVIL